MLGAGEGIDVMRLPTRILVTCRANGRPCRGLLVNLTFKVVRKGDIPVLGGPTDENGIAVVTQVDIDESSNWHTNAFAMDYTGLLDFTGVVEVCPENRAYLDRRKGAYEMYHRYLPFP